jgi:hypothetical protein
MGSLTAVSLRSRFKAGSFVYGAVDAEPGGTPARFALASSATTGLHAPSPEAPIRSVDGAALFAILNYHT